MILVCLSCRRQALPSVQTEIAPYDDGRVLRTLCLLHQEEWRARLRAAAEHERQAQAASDPRSLAGGAR